MRVLRRWKTRRSASQTNETVGIRLNGAFLAQYADVLLSRIFNEARKIGITISDRLKGERAALV
jgi:hypothetical protein